MKILYVTTISNTINAFLVPHIRMLINEGHQVDVACQIVQPLSHEITEMGCDIYMIPFNRKPLSRDNWNAYFKVKKVIDDNSYDIVHTHTPIASTIIRMVCKGIRKTRVIYTAHGFHFHNHSGWKSWCIYYPIEKWLSRYTDMLITINYEDYNRAKKHFKRTNVKYIAGVGLDLNKYKAESPQSELRKNLIGNSTENIMLLSVGELNTNKNHQIIIKALSKIKNKHVHYVICGEGPLEVFLKKLVVSLGLEKQVHFTGFRTDVNILCGLADVFIFPSKREGLGLAALEAMAAGLPIITSDVHGIKDYSTNNKTGYVCQPDDIDGFVKNIIALTRNKKLRESMGKYNVEYVEKYSIDKVIDDLYELYTEFISE